MFPLIIERARELFSSVEWRMYMATVIGRQFRRAPYGARRRMPLQANAPVRLAQNGSKDRALLVYVSNSTVVNIDVTFSSSPDIGRTNFATTLQANLPAARTRQFVLAPSEQLYGATPTGGASLIIGQEWY